MTPEQAQKLLWLIQSDEFTNFVEKVSTKFWYNEEVHGDKYEFAFTMAFQSFEQVETYLAISERKNKILELQWEITQIENGEIMLEDL